MQRPYRAIIITLSITAVLSAGLTWALIENFSTQQAKTPPKEFTASFSLRQLRIRDIDDVWERLQKNYYEAAKLNLDKLEYNAVKGFVAGLDDPYTVFMTPEESKEFENGLEGELEGIGAELEVKNGQLIVVTPIKNSPAEKAGFKPGDIILKIDGKTAADMTFYNAVRAIRGKKGTAVTITILRENLAEPFDVKIIRAAITLQAIEFKKLDGDIFHIAINQFNDHTKTEFNNALQQILLQRAKGIILDLRGNGGGFLDIAIDIVSEFIKGEKVAAVIKRRDQSKNESVKTNGAGRLADIPLVVLVNKGSASASEIVAGAIQDYKRGTVIGEKTFGKGSVQSIEKLKDGSSLRMTIAKWFTPLDRSIDEVGIAPDKEVKLTDEDAKAKKDPQLDEAVKYIKSIK